MENDVREQVLVVGVKVYDTFKDRDGNEIQGGCTVEYGLPYNSDNDRKLGYEVRKYTFRENKDQVFNLYKDMRFPCMSILTGHRENAFSNPVIDLIEPMDSIESFR